METTTLQVTGMNCMGCVNSVKRVLAGIAGVESVDVDLANGRVQIAHTPGCEAQALREAIESAGYRVVTPAG